ncbi:MAG: hypothetical protein KDC88_01045 [Ignavibacteriae bacterium]|nr:hypothetical protein [Ignavibacteriota bacterium]
MVHKKIFFLFVIIFPSILFGQFAIHKHIAGPTLGFSFLDNTVQLGLNHEYGISLDELGLNETGKLGIGGVLRYWSYSENFPNVNWSYTNLLLGFQSNYHFYMANEQIDPWAGLILAYNVGSVKNEIKTIGYLVKDKSHGGIWLGLNAGVRYWFSNNTALNIRIGFGTSNYGALDIGFDYKFQ